MILKKYFFPILYNINLLILISTSLSLAQADIVKYLFPFSPMTNQRNIGGAFGEYRSTSASGHFHNGTDMSASAGTPVLAVLPGTVAAAYHDGSTGYNSYVRIGTSINGKTKYLTYFHTIPTVSIGQLIQVGQQISTIAIDHVHLIDYRTGGSLSNSHLNAIRPDGGASIYNDPWKPEIRYVKFFLDNSSTQLPASSLGNKIDIITHVQEVNGTSSASLNNGTYKIGYKILSADRDSVVYSPPDEGLRYQFYNIPSNAYVNSAFYRPESNTSKHVYNITNGLGASNVSSSQVVSNNYWDVDELPYGNYAVMIFTEDVRGNTDTFYVNATTKLLGPQPPVFKYVKKDSNNYFSIGWNESVSSAIKGYKLYYSQNGTNYSVRDNEAVLTAGLNSYQYFFSQPSALYLRLHAVDSISLIKEGLQSDVYGIRMTNDNRKILIVDGFDNTNEGWKKIYHDFLILYAESFNSSFESCSNDEIINDNFSLNNYDFVIWILGDESKEDESFSGEEQNKVKLFLENGGKLLVTGSNIAYDLEGSDSASVYNTQFLREYLKAKFISDNSNNYNTAGEDLTIFNDLNISFGTAENGSPYKVHSPDVIDTAGGSNPILRYGDNSIAGVSYTGSFNNFANKGSVVYIAFPFETINSEEERTALMSSIFEYFGYVDPLHVDDDLEHPNNFALNQNYPNPFNPTTSIQYIVGGKQYVSLMVYDVLGNEAAVLVDEEKPAGNYEVEFNAANLSSGIYFYKIEAGKFRDIKKMVLLK